MDGEAAGPREGEVELKFFSIATGLITARSSMYHMKCGERDGTGMTELRVSQRRRVLKGAVAAFNARHSTIPCTVRDMSDTGCRLLTAGSISIPDTFELMIELDGTVVGCQVVRRSKTELGVAFIGLIEQRAPERLQALSMTRPTSAPSLRRVPIAKPVK